MVALTVDTPRTYGIGPGPLCEDYQVAAAVKIYEGAAVGDNGSGYARPLVAADPFWGFCEKLCDNTAGAAGAKRVKTRRNGIIGIAVVGVTGVADQDDLVYASDDATFTKTAAGNSLIGRIQQWVSSVVCLVYFEAMSLRV